MKSAYFEHPEHNRFVHLSVEGSVFYSRFGRVGEQGQVQRREAAERAAAETRYRAAAKGLFRKGYRPGRQEPALLAALIADPNVRSNRQAYEAYAEWLCARDDARGELIKAGLRRDQKRHAELLRVHAAELDVAHHAGSLDQQWEAGFVRAGVSQLKSFYRPAPSRHSAYALTAPAALERLLRHPSSALMRRLTVRHYQPELDTIIAAHAPVTLTHIFLDGAPTPGGPAGFRKRCEGRLLRLERVDSTSRPYNAPEAMGAQEHGLWKRLSQLFRGW